MPLEPDHVLFQRYWAARDANDLAGARELWEDLLLRRFDRVRILIRTLRFRGGSRLSPEDAEDATQEAWFRLTAMGTKYRERHIGQFYAAVLECAKNTWLDFGRKVLRHEKRKGGSLDETFENGGGGKFDAVIAKLSRDHAAFAAEAAEDEERAESDRALVAWAIPRVKNPTYREFLHLEYIDKLDGAAIAKRLGITSQNLYKRRERAKAELEKILRDQRP